MTAHNKNPGLVSGAPASGARAGAGDRAPSWKELVESIKNAVKARGFEITGYDEVEPHPGRPEGYLMINTTGNGLWLDVHATTDDVDVSVSQDIDNPGLPPGIIISVRGSPNSISQALDVALRLVKEARKLKPEDILRIPDGVIEIDVYLDEGKTKIVCGLDTYPRAEFDGIPTIEEIFSAIHEGD